MHIPFKQVTAHSEFVIKKLNQDQLLKRLVYGIIDRHFLAEFTWSGKSTSGKKKLAFRDLTNVLNLIQTVIRIKYNSYSDEDFRDSVINKVLKFAYM